MSEAFCPAGGGNRFFTESECSFQTLGGYSLVLPAGITWANVKKMIITVNGGAETYVKYNNQVRLLTSSNTMGDIQCSPAATDTSFYVRYSQPNYTPRVLIVTD